MVRPPHPRSLMSYLRRTPVAAALVVAAGVTAILAMVVLPAVDGGFASIARKPRGTVIPASTKTPVPPTSAAAASVLQPTPSPTPRLIVPPPTQPTATPTPRAISPLSLGRAGDDGQPRRNRAASQPTSTPSVRPRTLTVPRAKATATPAANDHRQKKQRPDDRRAKNTRAEPTIAPRTADRQGERDANRDRPETDRTKKDAGKKKTNDKKKTGEPAKKRDNDTQQSDKKKPKQQARDR